MLSRAGMARLCSSSVPQPDSSTAPRPSIAASTRRLAPGRGFRRDRTPAGRPSGTTGSLSLERHSTLVTLSESRPDPAGGWPCRFGRVSTGPDAAGTAPQAVWDAASAEALHPAARETLLAALDKGYADPRRLHGAGSVGAAAAGQRPRGGRVLPRRASRRGVLHRQRDRGRAPRACWGCTAAGPATAAHRPHRRRALLGRPRRRLGRRPRRGGPRRPGGSGRRRRTSPRRWRAHPSRSRWWPCRAPTTRWARSSRSTAVADAVPDVPLFVAAGASAGRLPLPRGLGGRRGVRPQVGRPRRASGVLLVRKGARWRNRVPRRRPGRRAGRGLRERPRRAGRRRRPARGGRGARRGEPAPHAPHRPDPRRGGAAAGRRGGGRPGGPAPPPADLLLPVRRRGGPGDRAGPPRLRHRQRVRLHGLDPDPEPRAGGDGRPHPRQRPAVPPVADRGVTADGHRGRRRPFPGRAAGGAGRAAWQAGSDERGGARLPGAAVPAAGDRAGPAPLRRRRR